MSDDLSSHVSAAAIDGLKHLLEVVGQTAAPLRVATLSQALQQIPVHERLALMTSLLPLLKHDLDGYVSGATPEKLFSVMQLALFVAALYEDSLTSPSAYLHLDNYPTWAWPAVRAAQQQRQSEA